MESRCVEDSARRDAQKALNHVLRSRDVGIYVEPARISVNGYLDRWLESAAKPRIATRTYSDYERVLARYVRPVLGTRRVDSVRTLDVQGLYSGMLARGIGPRAVRMTHAVLSSALRQAVKWGMLATNPAALVDLPKQQRREMRALTPEEVRKLRQAARGTRFELLWELMLTTGCRPGEALALRWIDLNLQESAVTIRQSLSRVRGRPYELKAPKTRRSERTIALPARLVTALEAHRRDQAEHALKLGALYRRDLGLVFATQNGEPLDERNLARRYFKPTVEAAELRDPMSVTPYTLRHTCATLALQAGINVRVVAERLGHANAKMTLDVYGHVLPGAQEEATERLEALLRD